MGPLNAPKKYLDKGIKFNKPAQEVLETQATARALISEEAPKPQLIEEEQELSDFKVDMPAQEEL